MLTVHYYSKILTTSIQVAATFECSSLCIKFTVSPSYGNLLLNILEFTFNPTYFDFIIVELFLPRLEITEPPALQFMGTATAANL